MKYVCLFSESFADPCGDNPLCQYYALTAQSKMRERISFTSYWSEYIDTSNTYLLLRAQNLNLYFRIKTIVSVIALLDLVDGFQSL